MPDQPQTLAYRVEIDQSSLSETVQNIQAAVGQAMSTAIASVRGFSDSAQATTSTALGTASGNLAFMDQQRSRLLTQPTAAPATGTSVTQVIQAVAVKTGMIDPGFSQTQTGMMGAANATLRDVRSSIPEMASKAGHFLSGVLGWGSMIGLVPGLGPVGLGLGAAGTALDLSMVGLDRMNDRDAMQRMLMRYGDTSARAIVDQVERATVSMKNVGFDEASLVARSAILNIGPEYLNAGNAGKAVMDAIADWRFAGKALGISKEDALAETGSLYRMGIRPGDAVQNYFAGVSTAAQGLGVSTTALSQQAMQVGQASMGLGYDGLNAQNQFLIQTSMVAEGLRRGAMDQGKLSMMAGFFGSQADQGMAIAQQRMASSRVLANSTFGQFAMMGIASGQTGSISQMHAAASGASVQDILTMPIRARRMMGTAGGMEALDKAYGNTVEEYLKMNSLDPTRDNFVSAAMMMAPDAFQTEGQADRLFTFRNMPWLAENTRVQTMVTEMATSRANARPAAPVAQVLDTAAGGLGYAFEWAWGNNNRLSDDGYAVKSRMGGAARGLARRAALQWSSRTQLLGYLPSLGDALEDVIDDAFGTQPYARRGGGMERDLVLDESELSGVTAGEIRAAERSGLFEAKAQGFTGSKATGSARLAALGNQRSTIIAEAFRNRVQGTEVGAGLASLSSRLETDYGVDIEGMELVSNTMGLRADIAKDPGRRTELVQKFSQQMGRWDQFRGLKLTDDQLVEVVNLGLRVDTTQIYSTEQAAALSKLEREGKITQVFNYTLGDDVRRKEYLGRTFTKGSKAAAMLEGLGGNAQSTDLADAIRIATLNNEFTKEYAGGKGGMTPGEAATVELMQAGTSGKTRAPKGFDAGSGTLDDKLDRLIVAVSQLVSAMSNKVTDDKVQPKKPGER